MRHAARLVRLRLAITLVRKKANVEDKGHCAGLLRYQALRFPGIKEFPSIDLLSRKNAKGERDFRASKLLKRAFLTPSQFISLCPPRFLVTISFPAALDV